MKTKQYLLSVAAIAACGITATQAHATLILQAGDLIASSDTSPPFNNCEPGCIYDVFNVNGGTNDGSLDLLYKADAGTGDEEGTFIGSYTTLFAPSADPSDATISYVLGQPSIACPECYLAIKDGRGPPPYYFYDLAAWDGMETILIQGLWPNSGAISHVSIWGRDGNNVVPEPSAVSLLGLGLLAVGWAARRRRGVAS